MKLTRSKFLLALATGIGGVLAAPSSLLGAEVVEKPIHVNLAGFRALLGTVFQLAGPRGQVDLVLTNVEERTFGKPGDPVRSRQYSLEFRAADGGLLQEGTYPAEHDRLGSLSIFVTPTRYDASGVRFFRADFNQLIEGR
jgi:hypothetical protein